MNPFQAAGACAKNCSWSGSEFQPRFQTVCLECASPSPDPPARNGIMHWNHRGHTSPEPVHVRIGARAQDFSVRKNAAHPSEDQTATGPGNKAAKADQRQQLRKKDFTLKSNP
jgi:hypothetical protein